MKKLIPVFIFFFLSQNIFSQRISILTDSLLSSFRGLSVVNDSIVWVSGSNGTVGRSVDAGKSWKWIKVKGFGNTDFRDIEAFDENAALVMGIDTPAYILKTVDAGENWKVVYKNDSPGMFLDAMQFSDDKTGVAIGDPVNGHFFLIQTFDGGKTWLNLSQEKRPKADSGEACFAASGTNIRHFGTSGFVFVSGGLTSHFSKGGHKVLLPLLQGKESTGANSIAVKNNKIIIVVGGDFLRKEDTTGNCTISRDGSETWIHSNSPPSGYRSCVEYLYKNKWITCGLNGTDISNDDGMNWQKISHQSFNVVRKAKKGTGVYFAGKGIIGRLEQ